MKQICKRCDGTEQQPCYHEKELIDYIDCICTSDNWDSENQDLCLICKGSKCEWCNYTGKED